MPVLIGDNDQHVDRYRFAVGDDLRVASSLRELLIDLEEHSDERLVIVGPEADISIAVEVADRYRGSRQSLGVVLVRPRLDIAVMNQAMRAGVREVVLADDASALAAACRRSLDLSRALEQKTGGEPRGRQGKVVIVFAAKGGCGKTTISTNLADAIRLSTSSSVCLVDFDLQFGDVGVALQIDPIKSISDAIPMGSNIDQEGVKSLLIHYQENFDVLLAPLNPADVEHITGELAHKILMHLQDHYDYVIVDSPPAFTEVVLRTFDTASDYILLTTLDMPAVKNLKVTIDTLGALSMPKDRWHIVVNRSDADLGLKVEDVERLFGMKISQQIPNSQDVPASINNGVTLVSTKPRHPVSKAIFAIAAEIAGPAAAPAERKSGSVLTKLTRRGA